MTALQVVVCLVIVATLGAFGVLLGGPGPDEVLADHDEAERVRREDQP